MLGPMESPEKFKHRFTFLTEEMGFDLREFHHRSDHMQNILAVYEIIGCKIEIEREGNRVYTRLEFQSSGRRPLDWYLNELHLPISVTTKFRDDYDYSGRDDGLDVESQATFLRQHLPAILQRWQ